MESKHAERDWFAEEDDRIARLNRLATDMRQGDGTPMAERLTELNALIAEGDVESRPTKEDKEAFLRRLEEKYGKRPRKALLLFAIRDGMKRARAFGKQMGQPAPLDLAHAVVKGDLAKVRELIAAGVPVNSIDAAGNSLLMEAGILRRAEIAEELRRAGARVGLLEASVLGDEDAARECLDGGADVGQVSASGLQPLAWAAGRGHLGVVRLLLAHGADVNATSKSGHTPLMGALTHDHPEVAEALIEAGANVGLAETAMLGRVGDLREALEHGADIETRNTAQFTPLIGACAAGQVECARLLIEMGADVNAVSSHGNTPLLHAITFGRPACVELLLDAGIDLNAPIQSENEHLVGRTPLHRACQVPDRADLVKLLLERGADPNRPNADGNTPVHEAAQRDNPASLALLLDAGGDHARRGWFGRTPLHWAADKGSVECVQILLDRGAEVNALAERGDTPLALAAADGHLDVVKLLVQRGADVNAGGEEAMGALACAAFNGHTEVVSFLREHGASDAPGAAFLAGFMGRDNAVKALILPWACRVAFHAAIALSVTVAIMTDAMPRPGVWMGILAGMAIVNAPWSWKPLARLWWAGLAAAIACIVGAVSSGPHSITGWLLALAAPLPYGLCASRRQRGNWRRRRAPG